MGGADTERRLTVMFTATGLAHILGLRGELIAMVPAQLPQPGLLVTVTGVLELVGAVGLLIPATATAAALCLAALMMPGMTGVVSDPQARVAQRTGDELSGRPTSECA